VQFAGEQGVSGRTSQAGGLLSISAPVARVLSTGLGLRFIDLDPHSIQAVRQLAVLARQAQAPPAPALIPDAVSPKSLPTVAGDAMHTLRCLIGLERHMRSEDRTPESVAAIATSELAASSVDPAARELLIDALAIVQRAPEFLHPHEDEPLALQDRLMTTWEAAGLNVTEADSTVVEIVSKLLDGMLDDPLLGAEIKQCIRKLAIALLKVALQDGYFFFANEQHPVRTTLNRLGSLEPSIIGDARWHAVIDPLVTKVLAESDKAGRVDGYALKESIFSEVLVQLDALYEEQNRIYDDTVAIAVREHCNQKALIDSLSAGKPVDDKTSPAPPRPVPLELQRWLDNVDQLQAGDVIYRRGQGATTEKLSVAMVSDDASSYLLVDARGKKAASATRQELAMRMRNADMWMVDASKLPIVERSLFRILNELHQRIVHQVNVDEASGLLNQKGLESRVEEALSAALTMGSNHVLATMELDALGPIVQTCGQQVGSELLRNFVPVLENHVCHKGIAARLKAGRFAVLLHNCSIDNAVTVMDTLRAAMETSRCKWHEESFRLSISIGLVPIDAHSANVPDLFEAADQAYRAACMAGGNRVHVHEASIGAAVPPTQPSAIISRLIANGELHLRCQRVTAISAKSSALPQYEILLGVKNEHGEVSLPGNFLRAAQRHNQMLEVDRWVIETTLRWMADNRNRVDRADSYSINVFGTTLADENLLAFVRGLFTATRVSPGKIVFEVTESSAIDSLPAAVNFIHAIRADGCRVCLDKFGSAQTSLARLETLPIDYVKIDGALVRDIATDSRDLMVVRSLNEIGHFLGKKTVAECVESADVLARLRQIGVDYAQGFAIEAPFLLQ
jgi:diguanylate cyclase (GGDEF)-like protein